MKGGIPGVRAEQLFSVDFLRERAHHLAGWDASLEAKALRGEARMIRKAAGQLVSTGNEQQVRDLLINPILTLLASHYLGGQSLPTGDIPDYCIFPDEGAKDAKDLGAISAVGEAKAPGTDFDRSDTRGGRSPTRQVYDYLTNTRTHWGFLTDGSRWRLVNRDSPMDRYFEVNLGEVLDAGSEQAWIVFYNVFRGAAFATGEGVSLLDAILRENALHAQAIGDELKGRVYEALLELTRGFGSWEANALDLRQDEVRTRIRNSSFVVLFRLLFLFYAESRDLLPLGNAQYRAVSLEALRERARGATREGNRPSPISTALWDSLKNLFQVVDKGAPSCGVSPYNGGLFSNRVEGSAILDGSLDGWSISDSHIARAIDLLGTAPSPSQGTEPIGLDYANLDIRHLGSVYEGLLEYHLAYAAHALVAARGKEGSERWVQAADPPPGVKLDPKFTVKAGDLYLQTEKGERKASGSYYTPETVVRHIVREALGPLIRERVERAAEGGSSRSKAVLSVKVLDPAMGSGHFLVEAVEFLADALLKASEGVTDTTLPIPEARTLGWAKREVVRSCIYGVDLNELAVELAKVSLWLATAAPSRPLNFLDHRLRCGNSLVGSRLDEVPWLPGERPGKGGTVQARPVEMPSSLLDQLRAAADEIEAIPEVSLGEVKRKEEAYRRLLQSDQYLRERFLCDLHTGLAFDERREGSVAEEYWTIVTEVWSNEKREWEKRTRHPWVRNAVALARRHRALHWELEFPEVMARSAGGKGFDAVVGNPPYVRVEVADKAERSYLQAEARAYTLLRGKFDLSLPFVERGLRLLRREGRLGMIVKADLLRTPYGRLLQEALVEKESLQRVDDLRHLRVFADAAVPTCVIVVRRAPPRPDDTVAWGKPVAVEALGGNDTALTRDAFKVANRVSFPFDRRSEEAGLIQRIVDATIPLGQVCFCITGVVAHDSKTGESKDRLISATRQNEWYRPYIEAKEWKGRYGPVLPTRFIEYRPGVAGHMHRPKFPELFDSPKILIQGIATSRVIATLDESGVVCNHSLDCCVKFEKVAALGPRLQLPAEDAKLVQQEPRYDLHAILGVLSSQFMQFQTRGVRDYVPKYVRSLRIPKVDFDGASESDLGELRRLLAEPRADGKRVRDAVATLTPRSKSAGTHDALVGVVKALLRAHANIQAERRGFLEWLGGVVGHSPTSVARWDGLAEYETLEVDGVLGVLLDHRREISRTDPGSREFRESLTKELSRSVERLRSLASYAEDLDGTADALVYELVGLSEDEIAAIRRALQSLGQPGPRN